MRIKNGEMKNGRSNCNDFGDSARSCCSQDSGQNLGAGFDG